VQVAAVIADDSGIFAWGWNSVGDGLGLHAESHAIKRANKARLETATIYVASRRKRNEKIVLSKPCEDCANRIRAAGIYLVYYRLASGRWEVRDIDAI
jgi:deoxycytidylate deaminase